MDWMWLGILSPSTCITAHERKDPLVQFKVKFTCQRGCWIKTPDYFQTNLHPLGNILSIFSVMNTSYVYVLISSLVQGKKKFYTISHHTSSFGPIDSHFYDYFWRKVYCDLIFLKIFLKWLKILLRAH